VTQTLPAGAGNSTRKIIHIDMDAFFASVEQRDFPEYRGKPVIVGGPPEERGVVAAASYEAREFGIHSAMPSGQAKKLCPDAIFVYPRFEAYRECSRQIHAIFREFTDIIEPLSLDEAFLDVSNSPLFEGSATLLAQEIKRRIAHELHLIASAGVSYCKFLAKIASDLDKPNGLSVIRPEQAEAFIAALPVRKFFGVGKSTEAKMHKLGIYTGSDLKQYNKEQLCEHFGKQGNFYYDIARGIDNRPVRTSRTRKSIGKETTFAQDKTDQNDMWQTLVELANRVGSLIVERELLAGTVTLKVKYADFQQITRSQTVPPSSLVNSSEALLSYLPALIDKTEMGTKPVRLLGVSVSGLVSKNRINTELPGQLSLFEPAETDTAR
jgi:DNA polymerase-4